MRLVSDCTTDAPIVVPDGVTFDGDHHTLIAIDPPDDTFRGAIITSSGATASVINTNISAVALADACRAGAERLRGIYFEGASGTIRGNRVIDVDKGMIGVPGRERHRGAQRVAHRRADPRRDRPQLHRRLPEERHRRHRPGRRADSTTTRSARRRRRRRWRRMPCRSAPGPARRSRRTRSAAIRRRPPKPQARQSCWSAARQAPSCCGNRVTGNADVGIYIAADGVTVQNNRLTDAGADGYYDVGIGNVRVGEPLLGQCRAWLRHADRRVESSDRGSLRIATLE